MADSMPSEELLQTPESIIAQFKLIVHGKEPEELFDRLNKSLVWLAPELVWGVFFNGHKSTQGLCNILSLHAKDNVNALELYKKVSEIVINKQKNDAK